LLAHSGSAKIAGVRIDTSNPPVALPLETEIRVTREGVQALLGSSLDRCIIIVLSNKHFGGDTGVIEQVRGCLKGFDLVRDQPWGGSNDDKGNGWIFAVECKAVERCRDLLKQLFFDVYLRENRSGPFRLAHYVEFLAPPAKVQNDIVEHTFVHGIGRFYRFLLNSKKFSVSHVLASEFLHQLPYDCPNHLFFDGPKASKGQWRFALTTDKDEASDLSRLATQAANKKLMKRAHENLERYFIFHDPKTIACEVPIWLQPSDFADYSARFGTQSCITGHIDILRIEEDGRVGVWDYKPNAAREEKAAHQVWLYMTMVSKRMGLPLDEIVGGYFDDMDVFRIKLL
jgi:hypothetical protein